MRKGQRTCFGGRQLGCDNSTSPTNTHGSCWLGNCRELSNHNNDYEQIGSRRGSNDITSTSHTPSSLVFQSVKTINLALFLLNFFVSCSTPLWFIGGAQEVPEEDLPPPPITIYFSKYDTLLAQNITVAVLPPPFQIIMGGFVNTMHKF